MATRSDRTTGAWRAYKGSGPVGRESRSRLERREILGKPAHGRGSGTPFEHSPRYRNAKARIAARQARQRRAAEKAQRRRSWFGQLLADFTSDEEPQRHRPARGIGPHPHPTKRGPGRC